MHNLRHWQYGGKGHVRLEKKQAVQKNKNGKQSIDVEISLTIDKDWHINSRYPKDKDLVASSVLIAQHATQQWKIVKAEYPSGEEVQLKFNDSPLSLYQNSVTIKVTIEGKNSAEIKNIPLEIHYQSCSDSICLAPEKNVFYVFVE